MSIDNRLSEIKARIVRARHGDHGDRYMVLDVDAPALVSALQAVLDLHKPDDHNPAHCDAPDCYEACQECGMAARYPCPTVRAISAAFGEGA